MAKTTTKPATRSNPKPVADTGATRSVRILGAMTGTSCDGLDACCVTIDEGGWQLLWSRSEPYPAALRKRVIDLQKPGSRHGLRDVLELDRDLGNWYGQSFARMIRAAPAGERPQVIANHGQTVAHFPAPKAQGTTLQLGDPTRVATATGLTVVSKLRDGDMAAGGEGAPLLPMFHRIIAEQLESDGVAIHNIGGISNLTYIPAGTRGEPIAFDTGPGNVWIDAAAELATGGKSRMDRGGKLARAGQVDVAAVQKLMRHPFFKKPAPKSTGRDDFPFELLRAATRARGADLVATATAFTVESIAVSYEREILDRGRELTAILVCGGGAKNPVLIDLLASRLPEVLVSPLGVYGFDEQLVESQAFAFFGMLALMGKPVGGSWTGVKAFGPPAHIVPGENWAEVLEALGAMG